MILRPLRPGEEGLLNSTFNQVFKQGRTLAEWYWKFGRDGPWYVMLAWSEAGELLAQWAGVPMRLWAFGHELQAAQIVDVFSRPKARSSLLAFGPYLRVMQAFHHEWCGPHGFGLLFGFPSLRPMLLDQKTGEYTQIPDLPVPVWTKKGTHRAMRLPRPGLQVGLDGEAADWLWAAVRQRLPLSCIKDGAYVARRFRGRPGVAYHHLVFFRGGKPRAYGIFCPQGKVLAWADLLWDGERVSDVGAVLAAAEAWARDRGCLELQGWLYGDEALATALTSVGWQRTEHPKVRWLGRSFDPRIPPEKVPGALHFTLGDSDLV